MLKSLLKKGLGLDRYCTSLNNEEECWSVREGYLQAFLHDIKPIPVSIAKFKMEDNIFHQRQKILTPRLPILIGTKKGKQFVIDGYHRLAQANMRGEKTIMAYVLPADVTSHVRSRFNPALDYIDNFMKFPMPKF